MTHKYGPYYTENGSLMDKTTGECISTPTMLIDNQSDRPILLKIGDAELVEKHFNKMTTKYIEIGANYIIKDLCCIKLNTPALSSDEIATIFNAALNCTGHPILHALCNMPKDMNTIRSQIQILQKVGY